MSYQGIWTPELGEKVIATLNRHTKLPNFGLVAGQSVASAIDEVLGTGKPVYNDIDIFMYDAEWGAYWPEDIARRQENCSRYATMSEEKKLATQTLLAGRVTYLDDPHYESDDYSCKLSIAQRELYSIGQTRNEGLLNFVHVEWTPWACSEIAALAEDAVSVQMMQWLVKVFDMNCTQAAVDLRTGKLHVTPLFEKFLQSRQLQVVTGYTPVHSLLRYLKKRNELGAYGNDEMHVRLMHRLVKHAQGTSATATVRRRKVSQGLATMTYEDFAKESIRQGTSPEVYDHTHRVGSGLKGKPLSFGRKYFEQYVKYQKLLNPYFLLTRHSKKDVWLLTSKTADTTVDSYREFCSPTVVALNFAEESLAKSKKALAQDEGFHVLLNALPTEYAKDAFTRIRNNKGRAYCEGMQDENLRRRWLAVAPQHPEFFWACLAMTFSKQIELLRKMRTTFKKLGIDSPWGALAYKSSNYAATLLEDKAAWDDFVATHAGSDDMLCEPLPFPKFIGTVQVRELCTSRQLQVEGSRMHHCVGGYSDSVEDGNCRIISLSMGLEAVDCSTLEWQIRPTYAENTDGATSLPATGVCFVESQNYAPFNRAPKPELELAAAELIKEMNTWAAANLEEALRLLKIYPKDVGLLDSIRKSINFDNMDDDIPF